MSQAPSPWAQPDAPPAVPAPRSRQIPAWGRIGGIDASDLDLGLRMELTEHYAGLIAVGAHGGAGTTTLAGIAGLRDGGMVWPVTDPASPNSVVIVARTDARGLKAARAAAMKAFSGQVPGVDVLGVVLMADIPGRRLPRALDESAALVAGAYPAAWHVPWIEGVRTGEAPKLPAQGARVVDELRDLHLERTNP